MMGISYGALAIRRPDVVAYLGALGRDVNNLSAIFNEWWTWNRCEVPQVTPDPVQPPPVNHDDSCTFATLYDYAFFKGATDIVPVILPPPNTSPGSGSSVKSAPPGGTTTPKDSWHQAVAWVQNNPLLALAGAGAAFFIFLRPGGVTFSRNPQQREHFLRGFRR